MSNTKPICTCRSTDGLTCKKYMHDCTCTPLTKKDIIGYATEQSEYSYEPQLISFEDVCERRSPYGNEFVIITQKQISAMKAGRVLYITDGEYGTFLILEGSEVLNDD